MHPLQNMSLRCQGRAPFSSRLGAEMLFGREREEGGRARGGENGGSPRIVRCPRKTRAHRDADAETKKTTQLPAHTDSMERVPPLLTGGPASGGPTDRPPPAARHDRTTAARRRGAAEEPRTTQHSVCGARQPRCGGPQLLLLAREAAASDRTVEQLLRRGLQLPAGLPGAMSTTTPMQPACSGCPSAPTNPCYPPHACYLPAPAAKRSSQKCTIRRSSSIPSFSTNRSRSNSMSRTYRGRCIYSPAHRCCAGYYCTAGRATMAFVAAHMGRSEAVLRKHGESKEIHIQRRLHRRRGGGNGCRALGYTALSILQWAGTVERAGRRRRNRNRKLRAFWGSWWLNVHHTTPSGARHAASDASSCGWLCRLNSTSESTMRSNFLSEGPAASAAEAPAAAAGLTSSWMCANSGDGSLPLRRRRTRASGREPPPLWTPLEHARTRTR